MKHVIENHTEYEISDSIRELLRSYVDTHDEYDNKYSYKIMIDISIMWCKFVEFRVCYRDLKYPFKWLVIDWLYIHRDVIDTSNYLFNIRDISIIYIYSLKVEYNKDYTLLIKENKINELFSFLNSSYYFIFKNIEGLYGNNKYVYRYDIRGKENKRYT